MKIIMDNTQPPLPLLCDLLVKEVFLHEGKVYVKHTPSGEAGHYKVYSLTDLDWRTLHRSCRVQPLDTHLSIRLKTNG